MFISKRFLSFILVGTGLLSSSSVAFVNPVLELSPYTRTANNSKGYSALLGLNLRDERLGSSFFLEPALLINLPYQRSQGDVTDLSFLLGGYFQFSPGWAIGPKFGLVSNFSFSALPVLIGGVGVKLFLGTHFSLVADGGISGAGENYLRLGLGFSL